MNGQTSVAWTTSELIRHLPVISQIHVLFLEFRLITHTHPSDVYNYHVHNNLCNHSWEVHSANPGGKKVDVTVPSNVPISSHLTPAIPVLHDTSWFCTANQITMVASRMNNGRGSSSGSCDGDDTKTEQVELLLGISYLVYLNLPNICRMRTEDRCDQVIPILLVVS